MSFILPRNSASKGIGVKENLLWHPFDDLRGLHDPNASEGGLQIPLKVALLPFLTVNITPNILYIALKVCL